MITIVPIVEGDGDASAVPLLLRRILAEHFNAPGAVGKVVTANGRPDLEGNFDRYLLYAKRREICDSVIVVLDADNDCPVLTAAVLKAKADASGVRLPVQIVYAARSFESWFLASIEAIRGTRGISESAVFEGDPDSVPDPKEWLRRHIRKGIRYRERTDQPALTAHIDIAAAHTSSRSFRRLCHAVEQLIQGIESTTAP